MNIRKQLKFFRFGILLPAFLLTALVLMCSERADASDNRQVLLADDAVLLQGNETNSLLGQAQKLADKTGWDVRLVTADDTDGRNSEEYLEDYYMDHYRQDDGVAYLIDMDNREIHISTSGDAIYYLTDSRIDKILDSAFDRVSDGEYAEAFSSMMEMTSSYYDRGIDPDQYTFDRDTGKIVSYRNRNRLTLAEGLISLAAGLLTALGIGGGISARYRMKTGGYHYMLRDNSSVNLTRSEDVQVNRFVTRRHIPRNPPRSSGGGSSDSQSTIHSGSGGHTFGGGGRKF